MMKTKLCLFLACSQYAGAATMVVSRLDFESARGIIGGRRYYEERGFSITAFGYPGDSPSDYFFAFRNYPPGFRNANGLNTVPSNGTNVMVPFTRTFVILRNLNDAIFSLLSVDVAEYSAVPDVNTAMRFIGYRVDGSSLSRVVNINRGIFGEFTDFQTLTFDESWAGLARVSIEASDDFLFRTRIGFSMDNLIVSVVPEPMTAGLLLLVLPFMGRWRLR